MPHIEKDFKRSELEGLVCTSCKLEKGTAAYAQVKPYANGTPRYKAQCNACLAASRHATRAERMIKRINSVEAPRSAAKLLIEQNPEVIAYIAQRYRAQLEPLLVSERNRLMESQRRKSAAAKKRKAQKKGTKWDTAQQNESI